MGCRALPHDAGFTSRAGLIPAPAPPMGIIPFRPSHMPLALFALAALACGKYWDYSKAPEGYSIVRDNVISSPRNIPPVTTRFVYSVIEVDGASPKRETVPVFVDAQPGVQVSAGHHWFRARVSYFPLPQDITGRNNPPEIPPEWRKPKEIRFEEDTLSGVAYMIVGDKDGGPVLVQEHPRD